MAESTTKTELYTYGIIGIISAVKLDVQLTRLFFAFAL